MQDFRKRVVTRVVLIYAVMAAVWILVSDRLASFLFSDPHALALINLLKGWAFVVATAFLLYYLLIRYLRRIEEQGRQLAESEERFRSIFDSVDEAILVYLPSDDVIIEANRRASELFGYSREEILRASLAEISSSLLPCKPEEAMQWVESVKTAGSQRFDWRGLHRNGGQFWAGVSMNRATIGGAK